jgi:hypothetical protein
MNKTKRPPANDSTILEPHVIVPPAVYTAVEARKALRLRESTIRREVKEGRLHVSRRAGRYCVLGSWLLMRIESGELQRRQPAATSVNGSEAPAA